MLRPWQVLLSPSDVTGATEAARERLAKCQMIYTLDTDLFRERGRVGVLTQDAFDRVRAGLEVVLSTDA